MITSESPTIRDSARKLPQARFRAGRGRRRPWPAPPVRAAPGRGSPALPRSPRSGFRRGRGQGRRARRVVRRDPPYGAGLGIPVLHFPGAGQDRVHLLRAVILIEEKVEVGVLPAAVQVFDRQPDGKLHVRSGERTQRGICIDYAPVDRRGVGAAECLVVRQLRLAFGEDHRSAGVGELVQRIQRRAREHAARRDHPARYTWPLRLRRPPASTLAVSVSACSSMKSKSRCDSSNWQPHCCHFPESQSKWSVFWVVQRVSVFFVLCRNLNFSFRALQRFDLVRSF